MNSDQLKDVSECEELQVSGINKDCETCSCYCCIAQETDHTKVKMEKWFKEQIGIAEGVGPMGFATKLTLLDGLKLLEKL